MNEWLIALKRFNQDKNKWCIPKKGTAGYKEVMKHIKKGVKPKTLS